MTQDDLTIADPKMKAHGVNVFYGEKQAINDVSIDVGTDLVTAFIGPSGCGKSTFLRSLNRMNDTVASAKVTGHIELDGEDIYAPSSSIWPVTLALATVSFMRFSERRKVDLPQPDGPMKAVTRSVQTSIDTSLIACFSP